MKYIDMVVKHVSFYVTVELGVDEHWYTLHQVWKEKIESKPEDYHEYEIISLPESYPECQPLKDMYDAQQRIEYALRAGKYKVRNGKNS